MVTAANLNLATQLTLCAVLICLETVRAAFQSCETAVDEEYVQLAAKHIQRSYHPRCALKLLIPKRRQDVLEDQILQLGRILTTKSSLTVTQAIFTLDTNLTYNNPVLDNFLRWRMKCIVNVMHISPQDCSNETALQDMISFWLKLSSRDCSNNLVLLFSRQPTAEEIQFIRLRFRNYLSICFMDAERLAMTCLAAGQLSMSAAGIVTDTKVNNNT
jgi:hypothetical protein